MIKIKYLVLFSFFALLPLLSITGCGTLKAPATQYRQWQPPSWEKTSKSSDAVWESIRGKKLDTSKPFTLAEVIDITLRNNPDTRWAWENARAGEAKLGQAKSELLPKITASGDITRSRTIANTKAVEVDQLQYAPGAEITYLLLDFGGRSASIREATQSVLSANFQFNQTLQDALLEVESAYYELYSAHSGMEAATADLEDAKAIFDTAVQKFQVGLVSKLDSLQAESNYNESLYLMEDAKYQLKSSKAALAQVMGLAADTQFEIEPPDGEPPMDITRDDVTYYIDEALKMRPNIAALRAGLRAKKAAVQAANSDLWPKFTAGGTINKNWYEYYGEEKAHSRDYGYTGYIGAKWDFFDGFYNFNKKRQAQAETEQLRAQLEAAGLEASTDVWTKYYAFNTAREKFKYGKALLNTAEASHELALEGYKSRLKNILDLLESQSQLSDARNKLVESKKDLFVAVAELAHATGSLTAKEDNSQTLLKINEEATE